MKNRNLVIVILAIICAGLLAGVVYTVTKKGKAVRRKNRRHRQKRVQTKRNHSPESSKKTERNTNLTRISRPFCLWVLTKRKKQILATIREKTDRVTA